MAQTTILDRNYLARRFLIAGLMCLAAFATTGFVGWRTISSANLANSYQMTFHQLFEATYDFALRANISHIHGADDHDIDQQQLSAALHKLAYVYQSLRQSEPGGFDIEHTIGADGYTEQQLDETIELIHSEYPLDHEWTVAIWGEMPTAHYELWEEGMIEDADSLEVAIGNLLLLGYRFVSLHEIEHDSASLGAMRRNIAVMVREDVAPIIEALRIQMAEETIRHTTLVKPVIAVGAILGFGALVLVWLVIFRPMSSAILEAHRQTAAERDRAIDSGRAKTEFLAVMSHEIRTPMNAVIGFTDLLRQSNVNEKQLEYLGIIRESGTNLIGIIDEILDYSRMESGRHELESVTFKLKDLTGSVIRLFGPKFMETGLELVTYVDPTLPEEFIGDVGALRQVLFNLVGNAIKFTEEGAVALEVKHAGIDDRGRCVVEFIVTDTGIGIPEEKLDLVFQAFTQADSTNRRRYGGTGLGLAICRRLVKLLEGEIQADSAPGRGTRMHFAVPLNTTAPAIQTGSGTPEQYLQYLKDVRVLIVDPTGLKRKLTAARLQSHGAEVSTARSANGAKRKIEAAAHKGEPFQIAVLDDSVVTSCDQPFWETLKAAGDASEPQLILLTGSIINGTSERIHDCAPAAVCSKPLAIQDLIPVVYEVAVNGKSVNAVAAAEDTELGRGDRKTGSPGIPGNPATGGKDSVLLAEDNIPNQRLLKIGLTHAGYVVHAVANGKDAVEAARRFSYDVVLIDRHMPVMDGIVAIELIRASEGPSANSPIIAVTAGALKKDRDEFIAAGADDFVTKPIDLELLIARIQDWITTGRSVPQQSPPASQAIA